ncbi:CDP-alcohol phosphatidyltransferase family protein [Microlunatus speluncae]|uniref:CDP-alcohol phosphatidyltransferase family protein n=1 Tax=Microlunatus speluncae TaxID=2594267 RepID=UPI0012664480|nr:CDP-alcohol phosphatidyltransferase family protein [Microlunatus speluncae]
MSGVAAGAVRWRLEVFAAVGLQFCVLLAIQQIAGMTVLGWVLAVGYLVLLCVAVAAGHGRTEASIGPANLITLARALLVGGVIALVATTVPNDATPTQRLLTVVLAVVAVILDGVDGRVARWTRTSSAFGARFDIEIDSVLALALAIGLAWTLSPLALVIGLARYLYLAGARIWPWLNIPLPSRQSRKVIGLLGGIALIFAAAEVTSDPVAIGVLAVAAAAVVFSFGRDIVAQFRLTRPATR